MFLWIGLRYDDSDLDSNNGESKGKHHGKLHRNWKDMGIHAKRPCTQELGAWNMEKVVQVLRKSVMIEYLDCSGLKGFGQLRVRVYGSLDFVL